MDGAARHLAVLQDVLGRDYVAGGDLQDALADLARVTARAIEATAAVLALWDERAAAWTAVSVDGATLGGADISAVASTAILEAVRASGGEIVRTADVDMGVASESMLEHRVGSYIGVPLFWRDIADPSRGREFAGCLYAHRTIDGAPFGAPELALAHDIARTAQPTLNVLRALDAARRELHAAREEVSSLRRVAPSRFELGSVATRVPWIYEKVYEPLARLAHNDRVTLLLSGPTGSGKSHLARAYHDACPRRDGPFVVLDCGSLTSSETLGAELFGYTRRSGYANAPPEGRPGKAALAAGGTLLVDEVSNLGLDLQPRLLRLIQEGRFTPLGGSREEATDIQVIAASNVELAAAVRRGTFREDLLHRLAIVHVSLPGLDARAADVPDIARDLLARAARESGREKVELDGQAVARLLAVDWSRQGNVRGLENAIRRAVWSMPPGADRLGADAFAFLAPAPEAAERPRQALDLDTVKAAIREHGSAKKAASALGRSYRQLYWVLLHAGLRVRDVLEKDEPRA